MASMVSLLFLISGAFSNKLRRMASGGYDAFTKYPPVPPLVSEAPLQDRGEDEVILPDFIISSNSSGNGYLENLVTELYIVNHDFPEKEQTVTQTSWFDPFTMTPWANRKEIHNGTASYNINETDDDQSNSRAISGSVSVSRTSIVVSLISLYVIFL